MVFSINFFNLSNSDKLLYEHFKIIVIFDYYIYDESFHNVKLSFFVTRNERCLEKSKFNSIYNKE